MTLDTPKATNIGTPIAIIASKNKIAEIDIVTESISWFFRRENLELK